METKKKARRGNKKKARQEKRKKTSDVSNDDDGDGVWRWWREPQQHDDGDRWETLSHNGPYFPPPYQPLPVSVHFLYGDEELRLSPGAEEAATFYAKEMENSIVDLVFKSNFMEDWRTLMTDSEREVITDLEKCHFDEVAMFLKNKVEETVPEDVILRHGNCVMDGHVQGVRCFLVEPPGIFLGRGDHPKRGRIRKRVLPHDVTINIGEEDCVPLLPDGENWKEIMHDRKLTWLASWTQNVTKKRRYMNFDFDSRICGENDRRKFDTARQLKETIGDIRRQYRSDWNSPELALRQRGVVVYFLDQLALRAGHEKKEQESADTVGCCTLRVEHLTLNHSGGAHQVSFDFLGKDSIRYSNCVSVEEVVYKNLSVFLKGKKEGDEVFNLVTTQSLNNHLEEQMHGLTGKVFRTYNACIKFQELLELTNPNDETADKVIEYQQAVRSAAILCNHLATNHSNPSSVNKMKILNCREELGSLKSDAQNCDSVYLEHLCRRKSDELRRKTLKNMKHTEDGKKLSFNTSRKNYIDPRISVAWCKKNNVPLDQVFSDHETRKFQWAVDMTESSFIF